MRAQDLLARWGGEEFAVLLSECSLDEAVSTAQRMREQLATHTLDGIGPVTASIGVAERLVGEDLPGLVSRADHALYRAKRSGRNAVRSA